MNNLKFRAWDKTAKKMSKVTAIDFSTKPFRVFYKAYGNENYFNQDAILMQSTGLHDKNGVEIFEGDIVRNTHTGSVGRVHWCVHNTGFFYYVEKDKKDYTVFRAKYNLEVIGNIYENEELLRK